MIVKIDAGEWCPVYEVGTRFGNECDVPKQTLKRWARIEKAFIESQGEMKDFYNKATR